LFGWVTFHFFVRVFSTFSAGSAGQAMIGQTTAVTRRESALPCVPGLPVLFADLHLLAFWLDRALSPGTHGELMTPPDPSAASVR
jgi:hypothetical protein